MPKYKIQAECVTYSYIEIQAESLEQAHKLAKETDGGDFISTNEGEFNILESLTQEIK